MAIQNILVPHVRGYDFGVGVDRLSGTPLNQVVQPSPTPPMNAAGGVQSFDVARISSSAELQKKLGIDIEASYGCAAFGAGASARFSYMKESSVHSSTLFMTVTATVHVADLSIDDSKLTQDAGAVIHQQHLFTARYGDMFCRACTRGGLFVGVMRVETYSASDAMKIETELRGSYGFFSAEAQVSFAKTTKQYNTSVYCSLYAEGGPALAIRDPSDPTELLKNANTWMAAMNAEPDRYARPYEWTLSPIAIAEGPLPANPAQIQHAQDVLQFCAQERTDLLDQVNMLDWYRDHPDRFDWSTTPITRDEVATAARAAQKDLDLVARCASMAINDPTKAAMPAVFAETQEPPVVYRAIPVPAPLPAPVSTTAPLLIPRWRWITEVVPESPHQRNPQAPPAQELGLRVRRIVYPRDNFPPADEPDAQANLITHISPQPGSAVEPGSVVEIEYYLLWTPDLGIPLGGVFDLGIDD